MLDDVKEILKEIKKVEGRYLVSCFYQDKNWKIDFYDPEKHRIYTYSKINEKIVEQEDEIFQREKHELDELDIEKVKIGRIEALEKINTEGNKIMSILQVINGKTIWNITVITTEFKVYNAKVDAVTGELFEEKTESIFSFKKTVQ